MKVEIRAHNVRIFLHSGKSASRPARNDAGGYTHRKCEGRFRTIMLLLFCIGGLLAAANFPPGLAGTTQHGDANLINRKSYSFSPVAVDELVFPAIPIGSKSVIRFQVRNLPQVIYPSGFYLEVPSVEDMPLCGDAPWGKCIIRASLSTKGMVFFEKQITLGKGRLGSVPGRGDRRKVFFRFSDYEMEGKTGLPRYLSYDLQVAVIRPSLRRSDQLSVKAYTLLPSTKAVLRTSKGEL